MLRVLMAFGTILLAALSPTFAQVSVKEPPQQKAPPPKKVDDKDYKAAIERLPDQKFDPWRNIR